LFHHDRRALRERQQGHLHARPKARDERGDRLAKVGQAIAHLVAVVDEQRDLQRILVSRHPQNLARLAILAHDQVLGGQPGDRLALTIDHADIHHAFVDLGERGSRHEGGGEKREQHMFHRRSLSVFISIPRARKSSRFTLISVVLGGMSRSGRA
jgi:hypothetical protein